MYLLAALLAYFLNAIAVTIDKFLLTKSVPNPLAYIFYISLASLLLLLLIPFTSVPSFYVFTLASYSTLLWSLGAYFMFSSLKIGQISRVIPVIGTLTPLFLLIYDGTSGRLNSNQIWAAAILILALIVITSENLKGKLNKKELIFELFSSIFFAISYLFLKQAFSHDSFLTILVHSRIVLIPILVVFFFHPKTKSQILNSPSKPKFSLSKTGGLFMFGQLLGGSSQLLLNFSISLASPAIVNSLQGVQFVYLFFLSIIIFKEKLTFLKVLLKLLAIALIGLGLYILSLPQNPPKPQIGISFSPRYGYQLGLEPKSTFIKMLSELKVKVVRIPIYWDEVEIFPGQFNFSQVDFYLNEALKRNIQVGLVLGYKQPRWPECFAPIWVTNLMRQDRDKRILQLVRVEVEHFKNYPNIAFWQVENEPFLSYGACDKVTAQTKDRIKKEIEIVKDLDKRPILITDSGELSSWKDAIRYGDLFGTTLYRQVWNPLFDKLEYPFPPAFYTLKNKLLRFLTNKKGQTLISELQAEPWITEEKLPSQASLKIQIEVFPLSKLKENFEVAKQTGFKEVYLWGVEWWYFMVSHGHPEYLEEAKSLFKD